MLTSGIAGCWVTLCVIGVGTWLQEMNSLEQSREAVQFGGGGGGGAGGQAGPHVSVRPQPSAALPQVTP